MEIVANFLCPNCGKHCHLLRAKNGAGGIAHAMPMCRVFLETDPEAFLEMANNAALAEMRTVGGVN